MVINDPAADRLQRLDLRRRFQQIYELSHSSRLDDAFFQRVNEAIHASPGLTIDEAIMSVATDMPELWQSQQEGETVRLSGTSAQWAAGHTSLRNGMLKGTGLRKRGNGPISDAIDPRRTASAGVDLENDQPDEDDVDPYADPDEEVTRLAAEEVEKSGASVRDFKAFNAALKTVAIRNPRLMKRWGAGNKSTAAGRATTDRFRDV